MEEQLYYCTIVLLYAGLFRKLMFLLSWKSTSRTIPPVNVLSNTWRRWVVINFLYEIAMCLFRILQSIILDAEPRRLNWFTAVFKPNQGEVFHTRAWIDQFLDRINNFRSRNGCSTILVQGADQSQSRGSFSKATIGWGKSISLVIVLLQLRGLLFYSSDGKANCFDLFPWRKKIIF